LSGSPTKENDVQSHEHRGSRRRRGELRRQQLLEMAPAFSLGLEWREMWRAEQACKAKQEREEGRVASDSRRADHAARAAGGAEFAAAIARAEFGRFYWNEKLELAPPRRRVDGSRDGRKRNGKEV
jgi:hypothetical protein